MLEKIECKYCKKTEKACLFYKVNRRNMCWRCHILYMKGKQHINGKWVGPRKPVDKEARRRYNRRYLQAQRYTDLSTYAW